MGKKKNYRPNFRHGKDANKGHPAYIYDKDGDELQFLSLTHSPEVEGVSTVPLNKNPNPQDSSDSFLLPEPLEAPPSKFGSRYKGWEFDPSDNGTVKGIIKKGKNKKT